MRFFLLILFVLAAGCGPSFSPVFFTQCEDMMLPPTQGLNGPNPPVVGGSPNRSGQRGWKGKLVLVSTPANVAQKCRVHPAQSLLAPELKAKSEEEVSAVGYVQERIFLQRGGPGGSGELLVTVLDWKSKVNLGSWSIKKWTTPPTEKDMADAYPALAAKLKELHR